MGAFRAFVNILTHLDSINFIGSCFCDNKKTFWFFGKNIRFESDFDFISPNKYGAGN